MKTFVRCSGLAFIVSAFIVPIFILTIGRKKIGPSDGFGQLATLANAFVAGVGLLIGGIILLLIGIFVKD